MGLQRSPGWSGPGVRAGSGRGVLGAQLALEQIHGLQEGLLLAGRELVEDAGQGPSSRGGPGWRRSGWGAAGCRGRGGGVGGGGAASCGRRLRRLAGRTPCFGGSHIAGGGGVAASPAMLLPPLPLDTSRGEYI